MNQQLECQQEGGTSPWDGYLAANDTHSTYSTNDATTDFQGPSLESLVTMHTQDYHQWMAQAKIYEDYVFGQILRLRWERGGIVQNERVSLNSPERIDAQWKADWCKYFASQASQAAHYYHSILPVCTQAQLELPHISPATEQPAQQCSHTTAGPSAGDGIPPVAEQPTQQQQYHSAMAHPPTPRKFPAGVDEGRVLDCIKLYTEAERNHARDVDPPGEKFPQKTKNNDDAELKQQQSHTTVGPSSGGGISPVAEQPAQQQKQLQATVDPSSGGGGGDQSSSRSGKDQSPDASQTPAAASPSADWPLKNIGDPGEHDVVFGNLGAFASKHLGNKIFREIVRSHQREYIGRSKNVKSLLIHELLEQWREQSPPGRFLEKDKATGLWHDIGTAMAHLKTARIMGRGIRKISSKPMPVQAKKKTFEEELHLYI